MERIYKLVRFSLIIYYLLHHAVIRESMKIKLEVIFDASAKSTFDVSLNYILMFGLLIQHFPDI